MQVIFEIWNTPFWHEKNQALNHVAWELEQTICLRFSLMNSTYLMMSQAYRYI